MEHTIELTPFICESIMANKKVWPFIEKQYETNRAYYYNLYKNSPWCNHYILTSQTLKREIIGQKTIGILLGADEIILRKIIKAGWPAIFEYVRKQQQKNLPYDMEGIYKTMESIHKRTEKISDDEYNSWCYMGILAAQMQGVENDPADPLLETVLRMSHGRMEWIENEQRYLLKNVSPLSLAVGNKLKKEVFKKHNIKKYFRTYQSAEATAIYYELMSLIFDSESLVVNIIEDMPLTEKEIDQIAILYTEELEIPPELFLFVGTMLKLLLKAYREVKNDFLANDTGGLYMRVEAAETDNKKAKDEIARLTGKIKNQEEEMIRLRKQTRHIYNEATAEHKEIIRTQAKEIETLKAQAAALQNQIQEYEHSLFIPAEEPAEIDIEQYRGIIVGGRTSWHDKIKSYLPSSWRFIHPDDNIDLTALNVDVIFFATEYLNHAVYYLVTGEARKRQIPVGYIHHINPEEVLKEIKNILLQI